MAFADEFAEYGKSDFEAWKQRCESSLTRQETYMKRVNRLAELLSAGWDNQAVPADRRLADVINSLPEPERDEARDLLPNLLGG